MTGRNWIVLLPVLIAGAWWGGYAIGRSTAPPSFTETRRALASVDQAAVRSKATEARQAAPALAEVPDDALVQIARHGMQKRTERLLQVFPATESGRALALAAALGRYGSLPESNRDEAAAMARQLAYLKAHPESALKDFRAGLTNLPTEFSPERQFLVQFTSRLNADPAEISAMLTDEMNRPISLDPTGLPGPSFYDPATALDAMIDRGASPASVRAALMSSLDSQRAPAEKLLLIARYGRIDPEEAQALRDQIGQ